MGLRRKERKMEQSKVCGCRSVTSYVDALWRLKTERTFLRKKYVFTFAYQKTSPASKRNVTVNIHQIHERESPKNQCSFKLCYYARPA